MGKHTQIVPACATLGNGSRRIVKHGLSILPAMSEPDDELEPMQDAVIVAQLTKCLALNRLASMSDADVGNFLQVAADELADVPADLLLEAFTSARRECRRPAEIIPHIFRQVTDPWARRRENRAWRIERERIATLPPPPPALPKPPPEPPPTWEEIDALHAAATRQLEAYNENRQLLRLERDE